MTKESTTTKKILGYLNSLAHTKAIKIHGGIYTEVGTPDIIGSTNGLFFAIEVKRVGEKAKKIQEKRLKEWRDTGAIAILATCVDDVRIGLQRAYHD